MGRARGFAPRPGRLRQLPVDLSTGRQRVSAARSQPSSEEGLAPQVSSSSTDCQLGDRRREAELSECRPRAAPNSRLVCGSRPMKAIVIHAPKDLRYEQVPDQPIGRDDVRVKIEVGGICGSDLHYYHHGGFGTVKIRHPMILGHEIAGLVAETGQDVTSLRIGQRVAVNPSLACGVCAFCRAGPAQPLLGHALLRQRDADAPCRRRLSRGACLQGGASQFQFRTR